MTAAAQTESADYRYKLYPLRGSIITSRDYPLDSA